MNISNNNVPMDFNFSHIYTVVRVHSPFIPNCNAFSSGFMAHYPYTLVKLWWTNHHLGRKYSMGYAEAYCVPI
jgi:hypothetical protein